MRKILLMLAAAGLMAFSVSPALAQESGGQPTAYVEVVDQSGDGSTVTVPAATIQGSDGWVAIHLDDGGMPLVPQTEGETYVEEGTTGGVTVELDTPVDSSQTLYAMMHTDNPNDEAYRFPQTATQEMPEDPPIMEGEGVVVKPFEFNYDPAAGDLPGTGGLSPVTIAAGLTSAALLLAGGGLLVARRTR